MRIIAVVQARLGSTRLPGKVLAEIAGRPMLAHVLERARAIPGIDSVVLTTPGADLGPISTAVSKTVNLDGFLRNNIFPAHDGLGWHPHVPPDVLSGFWVAAQVHQADVIVRITGDCPLLDPTLCQAVLDGIIAGSVDAYATNALESSFGLDCQVFTRELLQSAHEWATGEDREHVCPWMERAERNFVGYERLPTELTDVHWAVDTQEDLDRVRAIYAHLKPGDFSWQATLKAAREAGVG